MKMRMMILSGIWFSARAFQVGVSFRPLHSANVLLARRNTASNTERRGDFWEAKMDGFRPTINDVERISWGKPAKQKGTGSRGVPHRLNEEERLLFDQARRKGFLEVAGSGWRSQRRDAPLLNSYRSLCDARGQPSIVLHKDKTGIDEVVVDLAPLRFQEIFRDVALKCLEHQPNGKIVFVDAPIPLQSNDKHDENIDPSDAGLEIAAWSERPIYHLPPRCIVWKIPRGDAKAICKKMASLFDTVDKSTGGSKKPIGLRAGKGRRHGGFGIG